MDCGRVRHQDNMASVECERKKHYNNNAPCPKTTWRPSSQAVGTVVMKNWEPLVSRPALAMERRPGVSCLMVKSSSANLAP